MKMFLFLTAAVAALMPRHREAVVAFYNREKKKTKSRLKTDNDDDDDRNEHKTLMKTHRVKTFK